MDTFAKTLGKKTRVETATYVLTTYAVLEVAENVFNIGYRGRVHIHGPHRHQVESDSEGDGEN